MRCLGVPEAPRQNRRIDGILVERQGGMLPEQLLRLFLLAHLPQQIGQGVANMGQCALRPAGGKSVQHGLGLLHLVPFSVFPDQRHGQHR